MSASLNYQIVSIEGNIGSGKSTLMSSLKNHYKNNPYVLFLKEPVDEWGKIKDENGITILEKFYMDQEKYAFSFQMMAYISRLNELRKLLRSLDPSSDKKYTIISERSLYTDKMVFAKLLFDNGKMEFINYQIYLHWFESFSQEFPVHKIIYVKTTPEICHQRIMKRAREGEQNIPSDYLLICDTYHSEMISDRTICNDVLTLDGNIDIHENKSHLENWIYMIQYFITH
jgi:deoxyadenosine/deoxycytidine kinase